MKRLLPFPLLWVLLSGLWLLLNQTFSLGHGILGALLAFGACLAFRALEAPRPPSTRRSGPWGRAIAALHLAWLVLGDIVRSNIGVARIVMHPGTRDQTSSFLDVPLELRHPAGLATLACILTATPGTAWARYDAGSGVLTLHILDLIDEEAWMRTIKGRYERRLLEIFE